MAPQIAPLHRFSVDDVLAMVAAGILDEFDRVELVDGVLVEMSPPGPWHASVVEWLNEHFVKARGAFRVRVQDTLLTPDGGFLQPDLIVLEPLPRDRLPDSALLIIEVAYSSRARDEEKAATYAAACVPEYWLVDVDRDEVLVHRLPSGSVYTSMERVGRRRPRCTARRCSAGGRRGPARALICPSAALRTRRSLSSAYARR